MKKSILVVLILIFAAAGIMAQTAVVHEATGEYYRVYSEVSEQHALNTAKKLDAFLKLYNSYFHFDTGSLDTFLKARIFSTKERYDDYLTKVIDQTRDDFIYLHYSDLEKSELVGYSMEEDYFDAALTHQSFIQFLRAFVPNPPLWIREGFAVFFEACSYDNEFQAIVYKENLTWLETAKKLADEKMLIPLDTMLSMTVEQARKQIDIFYPQSWAMVSFLINSINRDHNRILWDSIGALSRNATIEDNVKAVQIKAFDWISTEQLTEEFFSYLTETKSFKGLIQQGIATYSSENFDQSEEAFVKAINLEKDNYIPYYYLGLINYDRKNYTLAEYYYKAALDLGASQALTLYALGVNAYADNRFEAASEYLIQTKESDPEGYTEKADELLTRIESL